MRHVLAALAAILLSAGAAVADGATSNLSSTIAVTNTFQSIQTLNSARSGCLVQNNGTNSMWVFFGPIASATKAKSVVLAAGQAVSCNAPGLLVVDEVSITGTSTEAFYAGFQ